MADSTWQMSARSATAEARAGGLGRWLAVFGFAVAFAWVEAAVVFYLRTMVNRIQPYQSEPLPVADSIAAAELVREAATMLMLFTVGVLAGRSWRSRWAYAAIAFGVWDIFYYVFLKVICGWPQSLLDWDVLFLLPLPWWGPVISPVLIAGLMILWGTTATECEARSGPRESFWAWVANGVGIVLALYVFMADSIGAADGGEAALRQVLPTHFKWPLFLVALALMASPIAVLWWRCCRQARENAPSPRTGTGSNLNLETADTP